MMTPPNRILAPIPTYTGRSRLAPYQANDNVTPLLASTDPGSECSSSDTWQTRPKFFQAPVLYCVNPNSSGKNSRTEQLAQRPRLSLARYDALQNANRNNKYAWSNVPKLPTVVDTAYHAREQTGTPFFILAELPSGSIYDASHWLPWLGAPTQHTEALTPLAPVSQLLLGYINTNTDRFRSLGMVPSILVEPYTQRLLECLVHAPRERITDPAQSDAMRNAVVASACFALGQNLYNGKPIERDHTVSDNYLQMVAPPLLGRALQLGRLFARQHRHTPMERLFNDKLQQWTQTNANMHAPSLATNLWRSFLHFFDIEPEGPSHAAPAVSEAETHPPERQRRFKRLS